MYLLLERWEKKKNGDGTAWISGRDSDGYGLGERDKRRQMWRREDRAMQARESGT